MKKVNNSKSKRKENSAQLTLFSPISETIHAPYGTENMRPYKRRGTIQDTDLDKDLIKEIHTRNKHTPLSLMERKTIKKYIDQGYSLSLISFKIGRSKNCVITDVRLNGGRSNYDPIKAQERIDKLRTNVYERLATTPKKRGYSGIYERLEERIENLEMQIKILTNVIREIKNGTK